MSTVEFLRHLVTEESQGELQQKQINRGPQDRPGRLAVIQGELHMEEPQGTGAWPVLVPGPGVQVRQGERKLTGPTVLESIEGLSITVENEPSVSDYEVIISRDNMRVILKTWFRPGTVYKLSEADFQQRLVLKAEPAGTLAPKPIDPAVVLAKLQQLHVHPDLIQLSEVRQACLGRRDAEVVVARGVQPVPPVDAGSSWYATWIPGCPVSIQRIGWITWIGAASTRSTPAMCWLVCTLRRLASRARMCTARRCLRDSRGSRA